MLSKRYESTEVDRRTLPHVSVPEKQHPTFARLLRLYLTTHPIRQGLLLEWMLNSKAVLLSNKGIGQGYVKERWKSSLKKFYGRYGDLTK